MSSNGHVPAADDEIRRLGETLNAMLARLEAGLARERRFVADASHELRTPLAVLRTELDVALRRRRSRDELERALRSVSDEVDRLVPLADDLLVLARADDGRLSLRRERVSPRELLETVAGRFAPRATADGRELVVARAARRRSTPIARGSSRRSGTSSRTRCATAREPYARRRGRRRRRGAPRRRPRVPAVVHRARV